MMRTPLMGVVSIVVAAGSWLLAAAPQHGSPIKGPAPTVVTSDSCLSCHMGLVSPHGEDVGFASNWRPTMMANSARDPYWHAGVRREVTDHPMATGAIEHECSACHMPMARYLARHAGGHGEVFTNLPVGVSMAPHAALAADGVSCTLCHQITREGFGTRESFTANFRLAPTPAHGQAPTIFGPFDVDPGRRRLMRSATGFEPIKGGHLSEADACASCHTLFTSSLGPGGEVVGELPEQMPYLEWAHSAYRTSRSCQSCHMPEVPGQVAVTPVLGEPRANVSQHTFLGGNAFMQRLLARFRTELGVVALPEEFEIAARRTTEHLQAESAALALSARREDNRTLAIDVTLSNLAGHKFPTAYPSRRAWLHLIVRDTTGAVVFESGKPGPDGQILGNDNDEDGARFEPHHTVITEPGQVQVYEAVMGDPRGAVTTGLLTAVRYLKDNRVLPAGFDKHTASHDVAVWGHARDDDDFGAGGDRTRFRVDLSKASGPLQLHATVFYQSIGYRWAKNLARTASEESRRFLGYYDTMAAGSAIPLVRAAISVE